MPMASVSRDNKLMAISGECVVTGGIGTAAAGTSQSDHMLLRALQSSGIQGLCLDDQFRILTFTAGIREFFHLGQADTGRSLHDFQLNGYDQSIFEDLALANNSRQHQERQVTLPNGRSFLRRISMQFDEKSTVTGFLVSWVSIN